MKGVEGVLQKEGGGGCNKRGEMGEIPSKISSVHQKWWVTITPKPYELWGVLLRILGKPLAHLDSAKKLQQ